jgi:hypothetical protein
MQGKGSKQLMAVLAASVVVVSLIASSASAAITRPKLSFIKGGGATIGWSTTGGSSPADPFANGQSIRIVAPAGGGASAYTYGASEELLDLRGRQLSAINHLGFDSKGDLGLGAPRISLGTIDAASGNHTYVLSAYYCNDPLSDGWVESDFIHDTTDCVIFRDGVPYTGWASVAAVANAAGEHVVASPSDWFLIQDESPATVNIDRLTVQDWMWVRGGSQGAKNCNTGSCV